MSSPSLVNKNTLIRAGAGAGKTTRLISEVYSYFKTFQQQKQVWPRIVLTTFSNKATQEINERLLKKAIQEKDAEFFKFINSRGHLLVSTIHGVLQMFIGQNQAEFGLTKDFKVVNDADIHRRRQKLFRNLVHCDADAATLLEMYDLSELFDLVNDYFQLSLSLGLLTPHATESFKSYVQGLGTKIISDFRQSLAVLSRSKLTPGWSKALSEFPSLSADYQIVIPALYRWFDNVDKPRMTKGDDEFVVAQNQFRDAFEALKNFLSNSYHEDFYKSFEVMQTAFYRFGEKYKNEVRLDVQESQEISIADIETLSYQALGEKKFLFEAFSKKWDFWMIDEFQDTSPIQIEILNQMIGTSRSFFVGDPQQSIYYFRGSDSRVFDGKMSEFKSNGHVEVLDSNYRSHQGVLEFINEFFSRQYKQFQKMVATREKLKEVNDVGIFEVSEDDDFAQLTARQIAFMIQQEPNVPLEDIVVLSRTNRELDKLAVEFVNLGIPHYVHTQGQFFKQREVLDVLFFVRFLVGPDDLCNLVFLLKSPVIALNADEIKEVVKSFVSWDQLLLQTGKFSSRVSRQISVLNRYVEKSKDIGLIETVQLYAVNEGAFVLNHHVDSSGKKESNLWKVFYWLKYEMARGLETFLIQLDSILDHRKNDLFEESETQAIVEPKKIQMMTVHASKGLQFGHVIVVGAQNAPRARSRYSLDVDPVKKEFSVFIDNEAKDKRIRTSIHWEQSDINRERESEEFERLFYVALTRAKRKISVFTIEKLQKASWSTQLKNFFDHYSGNRESLAFSMIWERLDPNVLLADTFIEKKTISRSFEGLVGSSSDSLSLFFKKLEDRMLPKEIRGPLSFSSSKTARQATLEDVIISQKGIETHYRREKGLFDFSYYPVLQMNWPNVFKNGFREYRFTFQYGQFQLEGSIDFVFFSMDRILIIDYKSGQSTKNEIYEKQLKFYAQCLTYIKKLSSATVFELIIDYVDQKKVHNISYSPGPSGRYFDNFIQERELEHVGGR